MGSYPPHGELIISQPNSFSKVHCEGGLALDYDHLVVAAPVPV